GLWSQKSLVKLWAMRGTLHLLPSADLGIWLASLGTYTGRGMTGKYAVDSLTEAIGERRVACPLHVSVDVVGRHDRTARARRRSPRGYAPLPGGLRADYGPPLRRLGGGRPCPRG